MMYVSNPAFGAAIARTHARMGRVERAMRRLASVVPIIEQAPAGARDYTHMACDAAETLWLTERTDRIEVIEHNLRAKVVEPDFRWPMMDGRLAMARLCALQGRHDEAGDWFAKARTVLDETGRPPPARDRRLRRGAHVRAPRRARRRRARAAASRCGAGSAASGCAGGSDVPKRC